MKSPHPRLALLVFPDADRDPSHLAPLLDSVEELEDDLEAIVRAYIQNETADPTARRAARASFFLLAEGQRFETWRTMLQVLKLPAPRLAALFADDFQERLPLALAHMALADFSTLKPIVRDRSLAPQARLAVYTTLVIEAWRLPNRRTETLALMAELLTFAHEEPDPSVLWDFFMQTVPLDPKEFLEDVAQAVAAGEIPSHASLDSFRKALAHPTKPWWETKLPFCFAAKS